MCMLDFILWGAIMNTYLKTSITKDDINQMVKVPELSDTDIQNIETELKMDVREFYNRQAREYLNLQNSVEEMNI